LAMVWNAAMHTVVVRLAGLLCRRIAGSNKGVYRQLGY